MSIVIQPFKDQRKIVAEFGESAQLLDTLTTTQYAGHTDFEVVDAYEWAAMNKGLAHPEAIREEAHRCLHIPAL